MNCPLCNSTRSASFQGHSSWWFGTPTWTEEWTVICADCHHECREIRYFTYANPYAPHRTERWHGRGDQESSRRCECEKGKGKGNDVEVKPENPQNCARILDLNPPDGTRP